MKLNRNDNCWCGSMEKYKKCHMDMDDKLRALQLEGNIVPSKDMIKNKEQIEKIRKSGLVTIGALDLVAKEIKAGMSTEEIDKLVYDYTVSMGAIPAPLNYEGYPKSVCTSINDEICHGIPDENIILREGDIVNVDVSSILDGYYSDASRMFVIGDASAEAKKLVEVTKECLKIGIEAVKPYAHLGDIGAAIQAHAEANGYSVVREFGGHGLGLQFHEDPFVPHYGSAGEGVILAPGMVFTIEPMINQGDYELYVDSDNDWTALTEDGSLSAQWEHTLVVTETGIEILAY